MLFFILAFAICKISALRELLSHVPDVSVHTEEPEIAEPVKSEPESSYVPALASDGDLTSCACFVGDVLEASLYELRESQGEQSHLM